VTRLALMAPTLYTYRMELREVEVVEVGPRDGLQNEDVHLSTAVKVRMIQRAIEAGSRRIEATSFVNPRRVPALADADALMAQLPRDPGVSYIGLVFNRRGLERAIRGRVDEINVVVVATESFSRKNQGLSTDEMLKMWRELATEAHDSGLRVSLTLAAAFGCPFEGEVSPQRVVELLERALDAAPDELALADTIGVAVPKQVEDLVGLVRGSAPDLPLRCHFHNTRNTGYANALAAVRSGVSTLDASMGGIGGCPFAPSATGNLATEDLAYMLDRSGVATALSLPATIRNAHWLGEKLGRDVPGLLSRAGEFPQPAVSSDRKPPSTSP
jgi:hydroxymethylglutaryl-CoA lyase